MSRVAIRSVRFPDRYVLLDGQGVTSQTGPGGGKVKTQSFIGTYETFILRRNDDGTVSFGSTVFDNVFIRMDGSGVPQGGITHGGGGVVNAQYTARSLERFNIRKKESSPGQYKGVVGIESDATPGRFLRLEANEGIVNVQGVFNSCEEFEILVVE